MGVNIPGIVAVVFFYIAILVIGVVTGRKTSKSRTNESILVADRSLGLVVSIFTLTATMVGGGYILGTAESAAWNGVLQTQAPFGYCLSLFLAAIFYAPTMRKEGYVTMFDPFQLKYGRKVGALLTIPQIMGDLFWSAAVLAALGATISIILDINDSLAIIISASIAVAYTFFGGLYAVAYTDVIQLLFIIVGLVLAFPFCIEHSSVDLGRIASTWQGEIPTKTIGSYIDIYLLCILGGIPWQALFQRVLACKSARTASISLVCACFFTLLMAVPAALMGLAGAASDWNNTSYDGPVPIPDSMQSFILPLSLNYLTPLPVSIVGIGAIAAAVMSSADSSILATSSVIAKNIYQDILRPQASQREIIWVLRISIIVIGSLATLIAIFSNTIYGLYVLCSDLMYVVLFPQLTLILWMPFTNAYGSLAGFFASLVLRLLSGEPVLNVPTIIKFPMYDESTNTQFFPFRTFAMMIGAMSIVIVSWITNFLFLREVVPRRFDVLKCHRQKTCQRRSPKMHDQSVSERDNFDMLLSGKDKHIES